MKLNNLGYVNCISMAEYSCDKPRPTTKTFQYGILSQIRHGGVDYIIDTYWVDKIVELMTPNEILLVKKIEDGYYELSLVTYMKSIEVFKDWCNCNKLEVNSGASIKRFVKEVRVIWR